MSNLELARRIGLWGSLALGAFTVLGLFITNEGNVNLFTAVLFFLVGGLMYGAILFVIVFALLFLFRRGNRTDEETPASS